MSEELMHYGVKGMKWGIRRDRKRSGSSRKKNPTYGWSKEAKNARRIQQKSVKQMTNAELRQVNERVRLEQEYARLNPSKVQKGINTAGKVVKTVGSVVGAYNTLTGGAKVLKGAVDLGKTIFEKRFGSR